MSAGGYFHKRETDELRQTALREERTNNQTEFWTTENVFSPKQDWEHDPYSQFNTSNVFFFQQFSQSEPTGPNHNADFDASFRCLQLCTEIVALFTVIYFDSVSFILMQVIWL